MDFMGLVFNETECTVKISISVEVCEKKFVPSEIINGTNLVFKVIMAA